MLILFIYLAIVKVSINISIDSKLFIKSLEDKVIEIAKKAEFYLSYKERCEQKCKLSYNSCPMDYPDFPLPPLSCNQDFKVKQCANYTQARKLSIDYSSVQLKNKNELVNIDSQDIKHIVCSFSRLDEDFKDLRTDKMFNITKWQYIGAYNGVHRTYPGREKCDIKEGYDPRDRPWYASASSISKTLIIVIDNSESMSDYKKLDNAKTLASRIINSTAISDAAVIINFSDTSESNSNVLVRLNLTERVNAHRYINNISTTNKTANYESAVEKVYEILNTNGQLVVNCKNIVIFITDGESRQHTSPDIVDNISNKFINSIKSKDSNYKTTWITVGIEDNSNYDFLKRISCFTNGITFKMQNNNIQQIVLDYYYFISSLKKANNDPVWVEPYNDTEENGFGIKTTLHFLSRS